MQRINNMDELAKAIQPQLIKMVDVLAEEVEATLNYFLQEYYQSYTPTSYKRLYDFLHSAIKVDARLVGNKAVASVYIDYNSMDNYYNATGLQVAQWANEGTHGGYIRGNNTPRVWDDTIDETIGNGTLLKLAVKYLNDKGFNVKV